MANAVPTDPLESLTHKLIDNSHKTTYGTTVENVQAWELRAVLNELRARRKFCEIYRLYGPSQRARLRDAFEEMESCTLPGGGVRIETSLSK